MFLSRFDVVAGDENDDYYYKYYKYYYYYYYPQGVGRQSTGMLGSGSLFSNGGIGSLSQSLSSFNKSLRSVISQGTTQQQIFADVGYYRGAMLAIKRIHKEHIQLTRSVLLEFSEVTEIIL